MRTDEGEGQLSYRFLARSSRVMSKADRWSKSFSCVVTHIITSEKPMLHCYVVQATLSLFRNIW